MDDESKQISAILKSDWNILEKHVTEAIAYIYLHV